MSKMAGRKIKLYSGSGTSKALVAGGREHGITINNEPIDVTDKGDDGWRTLLADPSVRSVDIKFDGLMDGVALVALSLAEGTTALLAGYTVEIEGMGSISGTFHLSSIEIGSPHDDAAEISGTLASSGAVTFAGTGA